MSLSDLQEELVDDLAVAIARERGGHNAGQMARALLAWEDSMKILVGFTEGARKAVYYEQVMWGLQLRDFDAEGVDPGASTQVKKCRDWDTLERWVREHSRGLVWVHPRFQWSYRSSSDTR